MCRRRCHHANGAVKTWTPRKAERCSLAEAGGQELNLFARNTGAIKSETLEML